MSGGAERLVVVSVSAPAAAAEELRAAALELVPAGFEEVEDDGVVTLRLYVDAGRAELVETVFAQSSSVSLAPGWENGWRAFHRPVRAGGVWVGPPWEAAPPVGPSVVIDPGLAFGTGAHPTTRLCLELLASLPRGALLDVGCGSGVLALAAVRLGFAPVLAIDDDPVAVAVARANASANEIALEVCEVDAAEGPLPEADVSVANILLGAVERVLPNVRSSLVVTSGYLGGERPRAPGWDWIRSREQEGWAADLFRR